MGISYLNAVLNGLAEREPTHAADGSPLGEKVKLSAFEMIFLAVIAHRQPDPWTFNVTDTICYGDVETLRTRMHLSSSEFHKTRNALIALGVLDYRRTCECPEVHGGLGMRKYSNVYRIVVPALRKLWPELDAAGWRNEILHLDDDVLNRLTAAQRALLALDTGRVDNLSTTDTKLSNGDSKLSNGDSKLSNGDSKLSNGDTNSITNKKKTTTTKGVVVDDDARLKWLQAKVAEAAGVAVWQVNTAILRKAVTSPSMLALEACMKEFQAECQSNSKLKRADGMERLRLLVARLKLAPHTDPEGVVKPVVVKLTPDEQIAAAWNDVAPHLESLTDDERAECRKDYNAVFTRLAAEHPADLDAYLRVFVTDIGEFAEGKYDASTPRTPENILKNFNSCLEERRRV